jgi:AcrR family transcriptional regulator
MPSPAPRRRRLEAGDRRAAIVETATGLIAERGYRGLTVQSLADACGMTVAGVLHHMGSKDGVLVAVLEHRDVVDAAAALEVSHGQDPRAFLDAIMLRNRRQPEIVRLYSVLGAEALDENHPAYAYFDERYQRSRAEIQEHLTGHVPDPAATAAHVLAIMDGLQLQWLRDPDGFDLLHHWRLLADGILAIHQ